ncbi:MAG: hypothetical protein V3V08_21225 [Nannocystaceae bacterium]
MNIRRAIVAKFIAVAGIAGVLLIAPASAIASPGLATADLIAASDAVAASATCRVMSIMARKEGGGKIPASLELLRTQLRSDQFAAYRSFELLEERRIVLRDGKGGFAQMKIGYDVKLNLLGRDASRLKLHLRLIAKGSAKPLLDADYSVLDNGMLLVVAGMRDRGRALFAFQCRATS